MTRHLGYRLHIHEFHRIIWTREGTRKMIRSNGSTVMELPDTTSGVPLVLARSIKIRPGGNLEVPLECTRQLTDQMDIRINAGFHHKNPNIYIPPCCCKWLFAGFLISSCPKRALVWGNCCERLRIEIFVRVLRSSEVISLILCK